MGKNKFKPARETIRSASVTRTPVNLQVPIEDGNYGMLLLFRDYQRRADGRIGEFSSIDESNITDTIFLPLPENIQDSFAVRVQRFDQGAMGSMLSEILSESSSRGGMQFTGFQRASIEAVKSALPTAATDGGELQKLMKDAFSTLTSSGGNNNSSIDRFSNDAAYLLRRTLMGDLGRNTDVGTGTFINPKAALSFEGVEMKTHSFNWSVAPKSPSESTNLKNVIRTINKNILPRYVQGAITQNAMFRYPSMVDIFFVGLDGNYYYFFKTAMVQNFNVNYTPNGVSVLKGGRPAAVQMQMNVIESDIHTAEDYGAESFSIEDNSDSLSSSN